MYTDQRKKGIDGKEKGKELVGWKIGQTEL